MSILNVNRIQPVGSGQTVTINAANISAGSATLTAGTFSGNLSGNVTGTVNSTSGVTTVTTLNTTSIVGVSTLGVTTAYVTNLAGVGAGTSVQILSGNKLVGLTTGSIAYPGAILQVVQGVLTTTFSATPGANTFATVTGLSATITPTSASSKILVNLDIYVGMASYQCGIRLYRNGTHIGAATAEGSRTAATFYVNGYPNGQPTYICILGGGMYLDSPASTGSLTYTVGIKDYSSFTTYVNRSNTYQNTSDYDHNTISTITLMEISA